MIDTLVCLHEPYIIIYKLANVKFYPVGAVLGEKMQEILRLHTSFCNSDIQRPRHPHRSTIYLNISPLTSTGTTRDQSAHVLLLYVPVLIRISDLKDYWYQIPVLSLSSFNCASYNP